MPTSFWVGALIGFVAACLFVWLELTAPAGRVRQPRVSPRELGGYSADKSTLSDEESEREQDDE